MPQFTLPFSLLSLLISVVKQSSWRLAVRRNRPWAKHCFSTRYRVAKTFLDVVCTVGLREVAPLCCGRICVKPRAPQPCM